MKRSSAIAMLLLIWVLGSIALMGLLLPVLHGRAPLWGVGAGCLLAAAFAPRFLSSRPLLVITSAGLEHPKLGRVAWREIDGIRVVDLTRRTPEGMLQFHLRDGQRHAAQLAGLAARAMRANGLLTIPLRWGDNDALIAFEAAVRWRSTIDDDFLTAFAVPSRRLTQVRELLKDNPRGDDPRLRRLRELEGKTLGDWSVYDTPQMMADRLHLHRETNLARDRHLDALEGELQAARLRGAGDSELGMIAERHAREGLEEIRRIAMDPRREALNRQTARRARLQSLAVIAVAIVWFLLRVFFRK